MGENRSAGHLRSKYYKVEARKSRNVSILKTALMIDKRWSRL
jgi:hypothetical protein